MPSAMMYCCGVNARALCSPEIGGSVTGGGCVRTMCCGVDAGVEVDVGQTQIGDVRAVRRRRVVRRS